MSSGVCYRKCCTKILKESCHHTVLARCQGHKGRYGHLESFGKPWKQRV